MDVCASAYRKSPVVEHVGLPHTGTISGTGMEPAGSPAKRFELEESDFRQALMPPSLTAIPRSTVVAPHKYLRGLNRRALAKTCAYIEEHIGESITLQDLAKEACVSRFHFARSFRSSTGYSPMAYLLKLRIERAKEILLGGEHMISAIAAALGFFDQSHFARSFRRLTGFSPREFVRFGERTDTSNSSRGSKCGNRQGWQALSLQLTRDGVRHP